MVPTSWAIRSERQETRAGGGRLVERSVSETGCHTVADARKVSLALISPRVQQEHEYVEPKEILERSKATGEFSYPEGATIAGIIGSFVGTVR